MDLTLIDDGKIDLHLRQSPIERERWEMLCTKKVVDRSVRVRPQHSD